MFAVCLRITYTKDEVKPQDPNALVPAEDANKNKNPIDELKEDIKKINESSNEPCKTELITSFGLIGLQYPEEMDLDMCPKVKRSCCKVSDQLNIYKNWIQDKEKSRLKKRFKFHRKVYYKMLDASLEIFKRAKALNEELKNRSTSNCKVLARRLMHFKLKDIIPKLKEKIKTMHDFFETSYQSFYCTLCDADSTHHFQLKKERFVYTEKYCRDILVETLPVMLYLHSHFSKFLNIASRFMISCDIHGNYKEKILQDKFKFSTLKSTFEDLDSCKKNRNDMAWMKYCKPICEKFSFTQFNFFFEPKLKAYNRYMHFYEERMAIYKKQEEIEKERKKNEAQGLQDDKVKQVRRLLAIDDKPVKKEQVVGITADVGADTSMFSMPFRNPEVFEPVIGSDIQFHKIKSVFEEEGLDPLDMGKQTFINQRTFRTVMKNIDKVNGHKLEEAEKEKLLELSLETTNGTQALLSKGQGGEEGNEDKDGEDEENGGEKKNDVEDGAIAARKATNIITSLTIILPIIILLK